MSGGQRRPPFTGNHLLHPAWAGYGFFLTGGGFGTFHTQSSKNALDNGTPVDPGTQHFAFFRVPDGAGGYIYYIGASDKSQVGDEEFDFQDMVVRVGAAQVPVPEPTSMLLLATGLLGVGLGVARRWKRA